MAATLSLYTSSIYLSSQFKPKFESFSKSIPKFNTTSNSTHYCFSTPSQFGRFLTNEELNKLDFLEKYSYNCKLGSGYLRIRAMNEFEVDMIVGLLAESFADSMVLPNMYLSVLGFLVKQYLIERRGLIPHAVTLIGYFREDEMAADVGDLAGTVEVSFNAKGANATPPTPTPPKNCPYICNMTVQNQLRRRGIGWHLLKASEELIAKMGSSREVYLHCRLIDDAPFNMYNKAGYQVVKTDTLLILLTLQRRKHLMCKQLKPLEISIVEDQQLPPLILPGIQPATLLSPIDGRNDDASFT